MWWFHLVLSFGFIAWLPYTKMMHVITAPLNIYTANLVPLGATLKSIDFEKAESFGVNSLESFTWKDLLDLDACTECGRCTAVCPANIVGKELSPRDIILQLRDLMHEEVRISDFGFRNDEARSNSNGSDVNVTAHDSGKSEIRNPKSEIIGAVPATSPVSLWQCTTCAACMEACPVFIEQMPKIVDMRRYLVMEEAEFPDTMQEAIMSLEKRGHPFSGTQATRLDWTEGLNVKQISDAKDAEVLAVGWLRRGAHRAQPAGDTRDCATAEQAGVKFAIMGREEKCSGDPARRIGNEFLFETAGERERREPEQASTSGKSSPPARTASTPSGTSTRNTVVAFEVYHHSEYLARPRRRGQTQGPESLATRRSHFTILATWVVRTAFMTRPAQLVQISAARSASRDGAEPRARVSVAAAAAA